MNKPDSGFSLLEALTVIGLIGIVSAVAIVQMSTTAAIFDADTAANLVQSQIRYARQVAVDQRREVDIAFVDPNRITITRQDGGGATTELVDETLPDGYTFGLPASVGDTPDAYGNTVAVSFNSDRTGTFLGDGTFIDDTGVVVNGTVFTIGSGNGSARAVTLTGASGRLKQYAVSGNSWVER